MAYLEHGLPSVNWAPTNKDVPAKDTVNSTATDPKDTQLTVAAANAPIPILYGTVRVGPKIAYVAPYRSSLVILAVWGHGETDSSIAPTFTAEDKTLPAGITISHHYGTQTQLVDTNMALALAGYTDTLHGITYSVITVPAGTTTNFPRINALIRGQKVYDPRLDSTNGGSGPQRLADKSTWTYSDNPAICLADFITSTVYGVGLSVDWASVANTADFNDTLIGTPSEKSRTLNLAIESPQMCEAWLETLRLYASCWLVRSGDVIKLVPDQVGSSVYTFDHDSGNIKDITNIKKRGILNTPNVMVLNYTDTTTIPYKSNDATVDNSGTGGRKESSISLPGINRYSQAYREATERYNKLTLNDLTFDLDVFDVGIQFEIGDIVGVKHPIGIADQFGNAKLMRVMGISSSTTGRYTLNLTEYDPAVYSSTVNPEPTWADTSFADPSNPPAVIGLTAVEEVYQLENGIWASRIKATWSPAINYPYLSTYLVETYQAGNLIDTKRIREQTYRSATLVEGLEYVIKVAVISSIGSVGEWAQYNISAMGKYLIPSNVPSITSFEAGGRVYMSWSPSVDIDIWRYEVRYGNMASTWETSILIDRVDALRATSDQIPVGTWKIYVKALDSVGQYSTTAAYSTVIVTSDSSAFLVDSYDQTNPSITNMASYTINPTDLNLYYVTEDAVIAATKFPSTANTYTNVATTYHNSVTSTWLGEAEDFGLLLGGQWTGTSNTEDITGSHISYIGFSPDNSTWTYYSGLSQKTNARFARIKHEALTTSTLKITQPTQNIRLDAIPREEVGFATSSASSATTVFLTNDYVATKQLSASIQGTTAASYTTDNIGRNAPNPADTNANITITNTNTCTRGTAMAAWYTARSKHPIPSTGKWYMEVFINTNISTYQIMLGIMSRSDTLANFVGSTTTAYGYYSLTGDKYNNATSTAYGSTYTTGDTIGITYDADLGKLQFYKNNVAQGEITGITGEKFFGISMYIPGQVVTTKWVTGELLYAPPTGFLPLPYAFDMHIFNDSGARISRDFLWSYQGV